MSSVVLDFFHNGNTPPPHYITRIRTTNDGNIIDLAGNTIINSGATVLSDGRFSGGHAIEFGVYDYFSYNIKEYINRNQDFTVSFWVNYYTNPTSQTDSGIIGNTPLSLQSDWKEGQCELWIHHSWVKVTYPGKCYPYNYLQMIDSSEFRMIGISTSETTNTWLHYAMVRKNNILKFYRNGIEILSSTYTSKMFDKKVPFSVGIRLRGYDTSGEQGMHGKIDDFCIIKGKALWAKNFTPPTTYLPDQI